MLMVPITFQTVKYFNNEAYEADKYDEFLESKYFHLKIQILFVQALAYHYRGQHKRSRTFLSLVKW